MPLRRPRNILIRLRALSATLPLALAAAASCHAEAQGSGFASPGAAATGPFSHPSSLFLGAPAFDQIRDSDFQPGIEAGMTQELAEMRRIAEDPRPPTFENTVVEMERAGAQLQRVQRVFEALTQANTNDTLQAVETAEAPRLAAEHDAIYLDPKLFARVRTLYERRSSLMLDPEALQLLTVVYNAFVRAGARLHPADQAQLREINKSLSSLSTDFSQKLLAAIKAGALVVDSPVKLAGLSDDAVAAAARDASVRHLTSRWLIPLQNTTQQPALQSLTDRSVREALFARSWARAEQNDANDTRSDLAKLAALRAKKAALLGYPNFAAYVLDDQMAKTPQTVLSFMSQLVAPTRASSQREAADLQALINRSAHPFELRPWDWELYSEVVRKTRFDLNEGEIKPYFELNRVLEDGVFYAANQLYGITFKPRTDLPVYNPDVKVFEVFDKDGSTLGLFYFDYFKRDNKSGGAWMSEFVGQSKLLGTRPVLYNVANFTKPAPGQPALLTFDDVTTMFHEFGHGLHGLFASQTYPTLSGTNVARDFVEFPSQFNEHWALDPQVLKHYAVNYKTGAPMPQILVDKIRRSATFDQGYKLGELLAAAELDMQWHTLPSAAPVQDPDAFETAALRRSGTDFPDVPPRYRSSYFSHIWSGGYAAGYYAYLWTEMLDDDAFSWFMQHGGLTRENGQRFRDMILSKGRTEDYAEMFRAFYGKDPDIGPLLEHRGLAPETQPAIPPVTH